jgi:hypothetical protein
MLLARSAATDSGVVLASTGGLDIIHWHYHEGI